MNRPAIVVVVICLAISAFFLGRASVLDWGWTTATSIQFYPNIVGGPT